jgi:hypothetical protein
MTVAMTAQNKDKHLSVNPLITGWKQGGRDNLFGDSPGFVLGSLPPADRLLYSFSLFSWLCVPDKT